MKQMFLNYSNHPYAGWSAEQAEAARRWGEVEDMPFPDVSPEWSEEDIARLAKKEAARIQSRAPAIVMCQGEFTLTYQLVKLLKEQGLTVVSACSRRMVCERQCEDGTKTKTSVFVFVRFREY